MRISNGRGLCLYKLSLFIKFLECFINFLKFCVVVLLVLLLYFIGKFDFFLFIVIDICEMYFCFEL